MVDLSGSSSMLGTSLARPWTTKRVDDFQYLVVIDWRYERYHVVLILYAKVTNARKGFPRSSAVSRFEI